MTKRAYLYRAFELLNTGAITESAYDAMITNIDSFDFEDAEPTKYDIVPEKPVNEVTDQSVFYYGRQYNYDTEVDSITTATGENLWEVGDVIDTDDMSDEFDLTETEIGTAKSNLCLVAVGKDGRKYLVSFHPYNACKWCYEINSLVRLA